MARTTVISADGRSPLTTYINLLVSVPAELESLLDRDAEAVRILTAQAREADRRTQRWGGADTLAARYLARLRPRSGASPHDKLFRLAFDEARRDNTASVLCPMLEQAKASYERLISAARLVAQDDGERSDFDDAKIELGILACELMNRTKEPGTPANDDEAEADGTIECHVTLLQMAAMVNKNKRTLERLRNDGKLPAPAVKGGEGKADEWLWSEVRPILQDEYNRQLAKVFPADRFIRR